MIQTQNTWKKDVLRFLTAQSISLLGSSLVQYAIVWYITLSTSSGAMLTISTVCGFVPQILVSLFAGIILDRYDRKKIILLSDGVIAAVTLVLALFFLGGNKNIYLLFLVLAIRSAGTGIQTPAVQTVLPLLTPKEHLMKVNGIYSTINSVTMFLSPVISGMILSILDLEVTLFVDVCTAVIGIGITSTILIPQICKTESNTVILSDLKAGFAYLKNNYFVKTILIFQIIILFLISPSAFLTPLMVSRSFGAEVWRLTASEMSYSIGTIVGGIMISSWGGFKNRVLTTICAGFAYGVCMVLLGVAPAFIIYLGVNTIIGITSPCYSTPITVSIQESVEPFMQGRVFSFMQIAVSCALPLGMAVFGPLSDSMRVQNLLQINGVLVIFSTIWFFLSLRKY